MEKIQSFQKLVLVQLDISMGKKKKKPKTWKQTFYYTQKLSQLGQRPKYKGLNIKHLE